jgi:hypothetical protein
VNTVLVGVDPVNPVNPVLVCPFYNYLRLDFSSSGTTTSGSVATAELLSRLRQLQLPTLERPPLPAARRLTLPTAREEDDLNTSADLLKAPDLESSPVEGALLVKSKHSTVTTFNFSSDDESLADISKEKQLDYITLSSISSNSDH